MIDPLGCWTTGGGRRSRPVSPRRVLAVLGEQKTGGRSLNRRERRAVEAMATREEKASRSRGRAAA